MRISDWSSDVCSSDLFLQRQVERKREIDGLAGLIDLWSRAEDPDPKFAELLEFARLYRKWLDAKLAPAAIAERIAVLKLMDDDVSIYDANRRSVQRPSAHVSKRRSASRSGIATG